MKDYVIPGMLGVIALLLVGLLITGIVLVNKPSAVVRPATPARHYGYNETEEILRTFDDIIPGRRRY
jgi:hypothetical protein